MNTENNILVAEFMGGVKQNILDSIRIAFNKKEHHGISIFNSCTFEALRYDKDWNWLMPVVDKCSLKADELNVESLFRAELWMFVTSDINSVYNACVEFVKWYNEDENRGKRN